MPSGLIARLFGGAERDGAATALEAVATGFGPADLAAATLPQAAAPGAVSSAPAAAGRREVMGGDDAIRLALGQKVLHGWLQNRHQTLFPLTVNLRTLSAAGVDALADMTAVAAHACGPADAERCAAARAWFAQVGAPPDGRARLEASLRSPPALSHVLATATAEGLAAYAYVAALVAIDAHDPASGPFLDYLAARLALPVTVVRSATRRYRR